MSIDLHLEDDDEARIVHAALAVAVDLLGQVTPGPGAVLGKHDTPALTLIARRLDHERRHRGAVPNPNTREHELELRLADVAALLELQRKYLDGPSLDPQVSSALEQAITGSSGCLEPSEWWAGREQALEDLGERYGIR